MPAAAVGGLEQLTLHRLWLLTPLMNGPAVPGSVALLPSVSATSAPGALQPRNQPPPLEPPVRSLPMTLDTWLPAVKSTLYHSVLAVNWTILPPNGAACG